MNSSDGRSKPASTISAHFASLISSSSASSSFSQPSSYFPSNRCRNEQQHQRRQQQAHNDPSIGHSSDASVGELSSHGPDSLSSSSRAADLWKTVGGWWKNNGARQTYAGLHGDGWEHARTIRTTFTNGGKKIIKKNSPVLQGIPLRQLFVPKVPYPFWDDEWYVQQQPSSSSAAHHAAARRRRPVPNGGDSNMIFDPELEQHRHVTRHIFLIRHGQYDERPSDDARRILTPLGRRQAHATGQRLSEMIARNNERSGTRCQVQVLCRSNLRRAKETADIIASHLLEVEEANDPKKEEDMDEEAEILEHPIEESRRKQLQQQRRRRQRKRRNNHKSAIRIQAPDPLLNEGRPCHAIPVKDYKPIREQKEIAAVTEHHDRLEAAFQKYFGQSSWLKWEERAAGVSASLQNIDPKRPPPLRRLPSRPEEDDGLPSLPSSSSLLASSLSNLRSSATNHRSFFPSSAPNGASASPLQSPSAFLASSLRTLNSRKTQFQQRIRNSFSSNDNSQEQQQRENHETSSVLKGIPDDIHNRDDNGSVASSHGSSSSSVSYESSSDEEEDGRLSNETVSNTSSAATAENENDENSGSEDAQSQVQDDANEQSTFVQEKENKTSNRHSRRSRSRHHRRGRSKPQVIQHEFEILVCHANVIRYFLCRALQLPPEAWCRFSLFNGSITYLVISGGSKHVHCRLLGDIGHLPYEDCSLDMKKGFNWD